jgi:hypothetical protein
MALTALQTASNNIMPEMLSWDEQMKQWLQDIVVSSRISKEVVTNTADYF